jgi:hypothetical protein
MEESENEMRKHQEPAEPNREAGQSEQDPTVRTGESPVSGKTAPVSHKPAPGEVPPASETWVEGQPTSNADYQESDKSAE